MRLVPPLLALGILLALGVVVGVGSGAASPGVAGTHADHVAVDTQISSDGRVAIETVSMLTSGFVVLHADDGGQPGEHIGHRFLGGSTFYRLVNVSVDDPHWRDWGDNRTVWVVLHGDDGDQEFEPGQDRPLSDRSPSAVARISLGKSDRDVRVLSSTFGTIEANESGMTVRRASLGQDGHVVVKPSRGGESDGVLGATALSAGTHRNVTVPLDRSQLSDSRSRHRVRLVVYTDDGNGVLDDADSPVTVGGDPVSTSVVVELTEEESTDDGQGVITPSPTPSPPSTTATPGTEGPPTTTTVGTDSTATTASESGAGGFGIGTTVLVLGVVGWTAIRRRTD